MKLNLSKKRGVFLLIGLALALIGLILLWRAFSRQLELFRFFDEE